ncbi:MAG: hypothetical protein OXE97_09630 [Gammaproteobacteria bacterium]|nr:hypothetical protein [Gammaproteobacteria bacterium]
MKKHVEDGAAACTDEHGGYAGLYEADFEREVVNHSVREYANGMCHVSDIIDRMRALKPRILMDCKLPYKKLTAGNGPSSKVEAVS